MGGLLGGIIGNVRNDSALWPQRFTQDEVTAAVAARINETQHRMAKELSEKLYGPEIKKHGYHPKRRKVLLLCAA